MTLPLADWSSCDLPLLYPTTAFLAGRSDSPRSPGPAGGLRGARRLPPRVHAPSERPPRRPCLLFGANVDYPHDERRAITTRQTSAAARNVDLHLHAALN